MHGLHASHGVVRGVRLSELAVTSARERNALKVIREPGRKVVKAMRRISPAVEEQHHVAGVRPILKVIGWHSTVRKWLFGGCWHREALGSARLAIRMIR